MKEIHFKNNFLADKKFFNKKDRAYEKEALHIVFGIDNNFVRPMGVGMTSIMLNNTELKIVFHIITTYIDNKNLDILKQFSKLYDVPVYIFFIKEICFENLPRTAYISQAMYNRFLIPLILKDITDKALYLDSDIINLRSLQFFKYFHMNNNVIVAVVEELNNEVVKDRIKSLKLKSNKYFNSGMLYINITYWIKNNITEKLESIVNENRDIMFPDQDLLNIALEENCQYIDKIYNYAFDIGRKENRFISVIPDDVVFLHYVGRFKPWQQWYFNSLKEKFLFFEKKSLWKNTPITEAKTYKQMKLMGNAYIICGKYLEAGYWYVKYAINKMKNRLFHY